MEDKKSVTPHSNSDSEPSRNEKVVSLGRDIQAKIGQHLRTVYDEVVQEGVPDRMNELLQRLDEATRNQKN